VELKSGKEKIVVNLDITNKLVKHGHVWVFQDVLDRFPLKEW
jgi:hypothetical protein